MKFVLLAALLIPTFSFADFDDPNIQDRICEALNNCGGVFMPPDIQPGRGSGRPARPHFYCYAEDAGGLYGGPGEVLATLAAAKRSALNSCTQATRRKCHLTGCYQN